MRIRWIQLSNRNILFGNFYYAKANNHYENNQIQTSLLFKSRIQIIAQFAGLNWKVQPAGSPPIALFIKTANSVSLSHNQPVSAKFLPAERGLYIRYLESRFYINYL